MLISLTAVIWLTHALRDIDLITSQGQTILVFVGITGLIVPLLVLVIAPIGLVIAVSYAIHKLNSDSEIVVMNAAGMSPWRMFRPFLAVAVVVSLLVLGISAYLAPQGLRELRDWSTRVRTDVVANIVQPGRFTSIARTFRGAAASTHSSSAWSGYRRSRWPNMSSPRVPRNGRTTSSEATKAITNPTAISAARSAAS